MPSAEEMEERDFARTFRDFSAEFADLEQARDESMDADAERPAAPPDAAAAPDLAPASITDKDLQQLFHAHRQLADFLHESSRGDAQGDAAAGDAPSRPGLTRATRAGGAGRVGDAAIRDCVLSRYRLASWLLERETRQLPKALDSDAGAMHLAVVCEHYAALAAVADEAEPAGEAAADTGAARPPAGASKWTFDAIRVEVYPSHVAVQSEYPSHLAFQCDRRFKLGQGGGPALLGVSRGPAPL